MKSASIFSSFVHNKKPSNIVILLTNGPTMVGWLYPILRYPQESFFYKKSVQSLIFICIYFLLFITNIFNNQIFDKSYEVIYRYFQSLLAGTYIVFSLFQIGSLLYHKYKKEKE